MRLRARIATAAATALLGGLLAPRTTSAQRRPSEAEMFGGAGGAGGAAAAPPAAAGRPSEAEMFGAPGAAPPPPPAAATPATPEPGAGSAAPEGQEAGAPAPAPSTPAAGAPSRDDTILGDPNAAPRLSQEVAPEDPLKIGGQIYLRTATQRTEGQAPKDVRFTAPSLLDGYFDARPNDRLRGFVLGRMFFDPTLPATAPAPGNDMTGTGGMGTATPPAVPSLSGTQATRGPSMVLDQMWLRFDIKRTVFVTAGRQHVKWGTARFWTPTDYLHPERRNPIAVFDARPGFNMLKLHLPWEERGWNFYAFALVEGVRQLDRATGRYPAGTDRADTLGQIGGAARAEFVLGTAELGVDAVVYRGQKPRFGADLSLGVGDFDLYVDAGLRYGSELPRRAPPVGIPPDMMMLDPWVDANYPLYYSIGIKPQVSAGGTWSRKYNDNDIFTLIGEYFYNSRGYSDPSVYPALFLTQTFEFFYTGRHYAALGAILAAPWSWNYTTFSFTTLGNLSDQSFISRLDYSLVLLTHLRLEVFGAVNYGRREGEFRLGVDNLMTPNGTLSLKPQTFSVGLGLRVAI